MNFEPLKPELEEALKKIVDNVDDMTGYADGVEFFRPEYRKLKALGYFEKVQEDFDGTASVVPTYEALVYFDRKSEWEKQCVIDTAKGVGEKVIDKVIDFGATVVAKMTGIDS